MKFAALLLAMVVGLAGGVLAGEFKKYAVSGNLSAHSFRIASPTTAGGQDGGLALTGQDRRLAFHVSSTDTVTADIWARVMTGSG